MSIAVSTPNIALVKYWGKADEDLILPVTGSISLTLNVYPTTTAVELMPSAEFDSAELNGSRLVGDELDRIRTVLDLIRDLSGRHDRAAVTSTNTVPTAAGLASSSAAFAALAVAAADAYGLGQDPTQLSRIARRGSGSASRSMFGGMVRWNAGTDDATSFAEPLTWGGEPLAMVLAVVSAARKSTSSRAGMRATAASSPFYRAWIDSNRELVDEGTVAVESGDFTRLGEITELSTMRMHATMFGAQPPLRYLNAESLALFDTVLALREHGIECYATADAGPNVKILCKASDAAALQNRLLSLHRGITFVTAHAGDGARLADRPRE